MGICGAFGGLLGVVVNYVVVLSTWWRLGWWLECRSDGGQGEYELDERRGK